MKNEFDGFFENPGAQKFTKFAPSMEQVAMALMKMCGQDPEWYKKSETRILAWGGSQKICREIEGCVVRGEKPDLHPAFAGFLMLMQDRLVTSYEDYASEEEREKYPIDS